MDTSMERTESYVGVGGCGEGVWLGACSPELLSNDRTSTLPVKVIQSNLSYLASQDTGTSLNWAARNYGGV